VASFYVSSGAAFESTELTRGPWDAESQHAGPPAALVGRALERCDGIGEGVGDRLVVRVTYEILRPVPIAPLRVEAAVVRPGRRVDMVEATLSDEAGVALVRARGWRMLRREVDVPAELTSEGGETPPGPEGIENSEVFFPTGKDIGYHVGMDYRFITGSFVEVGPATCWMRMRQPLVDDEEPTPLQRALVAADSGNGISSTLDFERFLFINVDLTVHLHRMPAGEWVCLDSLTIPESTGVGLADTTLYDELGPIGRAAQSLLVAER